MKNIKKVLLLVSLFSLGVGFLTTHVVKEQNEEKLGIVKELINNELPDNLVSKEKEVESAVDYNGREAVPNRAVNPDDSYRIDFSNGTSTSYTAIATATNALTNGATLVFQKHMTMNFSSPLVFVKEGLSNITIDLNGKKIENPNNTEFIHIFGNNVTITSSSSIAGEINAKGTSTGTLGVRVRGTASLRPTVTITNVNITSGGDSALINQGANVILDDVYLKSKNFYAIQNFKSGTLQTPF